MKALAITTIITAAIGVFLFILTFFINPSDGIAAFMASMLFLLIAAGAGIATLVVRAGAKNPRDGSSA